VRLPGWLSWLSRGDPDATSPDELNPTRPDLVGATAEGKIGREFCPGALIPSVPPASAPPPPGVDRLRVEPGEKWLILGITRSGKSVLARELARSWQYGSVVVIDTKGEDVALIPNARLCYWADDVVRALPGRVVYRPAPAERLRRHPGDPHLPPLWCRIEDIAAKVLQNSRDGVAGPTLIVCHELRELCTEQRIGPQFRELITAGAGLGISLALVTQRPQRVAVEARSEAHHVVLFCLASPSARAEAADLMDDPENPAMAQLIRKFALPLDHTWLHRGPDWRVRRHKAIALGRPNRPLGASPGAGVEQAEERQP
jgi:hypothetical protein